MDKNWRKPKDPKFIGPFPAIEHGKTKELAVVGIGGWHLWEDSDTTVAAVNLPIKALKALGRSYPDTYQKGDDLVVRKIEKTALEIIREFLPLFSRINDQVEAARRVL